MVNANLLRGKMVSAGYTQKELAGALGMSENTLSAKINGSSSFTLKEVYAICSLLNISDFREKCEIFLPESSH